MDKLIQYYIDYFLDETKDGYKLLCSKVCIDTMSFLYRKWLSGKEVDAIENITEEKKLQYWNLAKLYYTEKEQRIIASQAAYALELITGKN